MPLAHVCLPERGANDLLLSDLAARLMAAGVRVAGAVQTNIDRDCDHHCDMDLRVLPDGPVIRISQNLGAGSTGCRLDGGALEQAVAAALPRLETAQVLIVNKFGKHEAEGRGFRDLIGEALARGLPVIVGLNGLNTAAYHDFEGGLSAALPGTIEALSGWITGRIAVPA
jgi:nucleoside-triphosphatase THEP1